MTEVNIAAIFLPDAYEQRWVIVGEHGEASFDIADLDFRLASGAGRVFRFAHPDWPLYIEGHVSYDPLKRPLNPVAALAEPTPEGWLDLLQSFGHASDRRPSRLLLAVVAKVFLALSGGGQGGRAVIVAPHGYDATTFEYLADLLAQTATVDVWGVDDGAVLDIALASHPAPWADIALCALAAERDPKTGILKDRRSGDQTPLGVSVEVEARNSWPIFVISVQRAEVPCLKIEGFFFHLGLQENPDNEHENAQQFSRSLIKISEGTLPLDSASEQGRVDQVRAEFAAKAAALGVKVKEAKVRTLLAPGVEEVLREAGVDAEAFQDVWSVVQEQPDLLQGTYVYQSSRMAEPGRRGESVAAGDDRNGEGQGELSEPPVLDRQEASQVEEKPRDEKPQDKAEEDAACVAALATQAEANADGLDDEIPLDTLVGEIAAESDDEEDVAEIGEGPWDRDLSRLDEIEDGKPWMQASHIVEDAIAQTDRSEKGRVGAIRDAIRSLVADEKIVGYPALEGMIERLGFELVDCSKSGGPMIQHPEADLGPFLLGESAKANPLGGSSYHAGQLIEREEGNLQQAVRYLDWAAAHPMWGPESHYLKGLTAAIHLVISKNGDATALGNDPVGLFLRLKYFEWLPKGKPDALGSWALIAADLDVIDAIQRPATEGVDAQRDAAAAIWKGDLKNGKAFSSQDGVPSQNKDSS